MAYFAARDDQPAEYCQRQVGECDVYAGLIGLRYGSPVRDRPEVSYTELEFEAATEAGLPRLVFLLDEDAALPIPITMLLDTDPVLQARQRAFRDRLAAAGIMVTKVASPADLELKLLHALQGIRTETLGLGPGAQDGGIPAPGEVMITPGTHNLPRPPARVFVGRDSALNRLGGVLAGDASAVVTQAVYGLGGVGKSELALQHAVVCRGEYPLRWWITAEDPAQIQAGLAALAARLCPPVAAAGSTAEAADWAVAWLQAHPGWLLILDNVNDPGDVEPLLGQLTGGHILITTRRDAGWDRIASPIRLDVLAPGPATDLITARTGSDGQGGRDAAGLIAAELGYLPLALDQAAAYITQTRITQAGYLQRLREHPAAMYAAGDGQAQRTIARIWDITIDAIAARYPAAVTLLHILACYAPDNLPRVILGGDDDPDRLAVDEALGVLASYSMITLTGDAVSMHRLIQAVILARQPPEDEASAFGGEPPLTTALDWLDQALPADPDDDVARWPLLRALSPHADNLAALFPADARPETLARVQADLGVFHDSQGQYRKSLALRESVLAIRESALGPDHPDTVTALVNVAYGYWRLGRHRDALPLEQRALQIAEATLGPDHPTTATRLNNLAATYRDLGQPDKALPLQQRDLQITEATLGPDHVDTAISLDNLATTYRALGQADQALPLQQRALRITETTLGPDHPRTATSLNNLAFAYHDLGQADRALPLLQRALQITEAALGPDHPTTAIRLDNLAFTYSELGQADKALPLQQRALPITEAALGPDHPSTALRLDNLAATYRELGQADKALQLEQQARRIRETSPARPRDDED
jgi:tetratricopeptide (TPR) repeat protein